MEINCLVFQNLRNNLINQAKTPHRALQTFENDMYESMDIANSLYEDGLFSEKKGSFFFFVYVLFN